MSALWVYKNNAKGHGYQTATGDWVAFFADPGDGTWGGESTMGNASRSLMREMKPKDLVLAWQSDRRRAMGVLRFEGLVPSADGMRMRFTPMARFATPVPLLELPEHVDGLAEVAAFRPGYPQTLYRTLPIRGAAALRRLRVRPSVREAARRRGFRHRRRSPRGCCCRVR